MPTSPYEPPRLSLESVWEDSFSVRVEACLVIPHAWQLSLQIELDAPTIRIERVTARTMTFSFTNLSRHGHAHLKVRGVDESGKEAGPWTSLDQPLLPLPTLRQAFIRSSALLLRWNFDGWCCPIANVVSRYELSITGEECPTEWEGFSIHVKGPWEKGSSGGSPDDAARNRRLKANVVKASQSEKKEEEGNGNEKQDGTTCSSSQRAGEQQQQQADRMHFNVHSTPDITEEAGGATYGYVEVNLPPAASQVNRVYLVRMRCYASESFGGVCGSWSATFRCFCLNDVRTEIRVIQNDSFTVAWGRYGYEKLGWPGGLLGLDDLAVPTMKLWAWPAAKKNGKNKRATMATKRRKMNLVESSEEVVTGTEKCSPGRTPTVYDDVDGTAMKERTAPTPRSNGYTRDSLQQQPPEEEEEDVLDQHVIYVESPQLHIEGVNLLRVHGLQSSTVYNVKLQWKNTCGGDTEIRFFRLCTQALPVIERVPKVGVHFVDVQWKLPPWEEQEGAKLDDFEDEDVMEVNALDGSRIPTTELSTSSKEISYAESAKGAGAVTAAPVQKIFSVCLQTHPKSGSEYIPSTPYRFVLDPRALQVPVLYRLSLQASEEHHRVVDIEHNSDSLLQMTRVNKLHPGTCYVLKLRCAGASFEDVEEGLGVEKAMWGQWTHSLVVTTLHTVKLRIEQRGPHFFDLSWSAPSVPTLMAIDPFAMALVELNTQSRTLMQGGTPQKLIKEEKKKNDDTKNSPQKKGDDHLQEEVSKDTSNRNGNRKESAWVQRKRMVDFISDAAVQYVEPVQVIVGIEEDEKEKDPKESDDQSENSDEKELRWGESMKPSRTLKRFAFSSTGMLKFDRLQAGTRYRVSVNVQDSEGSWFGRETLFSGTLSAGEMTAEALDESGLRIDEGFHLEKQELPQMSATVNNTGSGGSSSGPGAGLSQGRTTFQVRIGGERKQLLQTIATSGRSKLGNMSLKPLVDTLGNDHAVISWRAFALVTEEERELLAQQKKKASSSTKFASSQEATEDAKDNDDRKKEKKDEVEEGEDGCDIAMATVRKKSHRRNITIVHLTPDEITPYPEEETKADAFNKQKELIEYRLKVSWRPLKYKRSSVAAPSSLSKEEEDRKGSEKNLLNASPEKKMEESSSIGEKPSSLTEVEEPPIGSKELYFRSCTRRTRLVGLRSEFLYELSVSAFDKETSQWTPWSDILPVSPVDTLHLIIQSITSNGVCLSWNKRMFAPGHVGLRIRDLSPPSVVQQYVIRCTDLGTGEIIEETLKTPVVSYHLNRIQRSILELSIRPLYAYDAWGPWSQPMRLCMTDVRLIPRIVTQHTALLEWEPVEVTPCDASLPSFSKSRIIFLVKGGGCMRAIELPITATDCLAPGLSPSTDYTFQAVAVREHRLCNCCIGGRGGGRLIPTQPSSLPLFSPLKITTGSPIPITVEHRAEDFIVLKWRRISSRFFSKEPISSFNPNSNSRGAAVSSILLHASDEKGGGTMSSAAETPSASHPEKATFLRQLREESKRKTPQSSGLNSRLTVEELRVLRTAIDTCGEGKGGGLLAIPEGVNSVASLFGKHSSTVGRTPLGTSPVPDRSLDNNNNSRNPMSAAGGTLDSLSATPQAAGTSILPLMMGKTPERRIRSPSDKGSVMTKSSSASSTVEEVYELSVKDAQFGETTKYIVPCPSSHRSQFLTKRLEHLRPASKYEISCTPVLKYRSHNLRDLPAPPQEPIICSTLSDLRVKVKNVTSTGATLVFERIDADGEEVSFPNPIEVKVQEQPKIPPKSAASIVHRRTTMTTSSPSPQRELQEEEGKGDEGYHPSMLDTPAGASSSDKKKEGSPSSVSQGSRSPAGEINYMEWLDKFRTTSTTQQNGGEHLPARKLLMRRYKLAASGSDLPLQVAELPPNTKFCVVARQLSHDEVHNEYVTAYFKTSLE